MFIINIMSQNNICLNFDSDELNKRNNNPIWFKKLNKIGLISSEMCKNIAVKMASYQLEYDEEIIVICDIKKIDAEWKRIDEEWLKMHPEWKTPTRDYISPTAIYNHEKYVRSREDLIAGKVEKTPEIGFGFNDDELGFSNGRHRFSNLRDCGQKFIPVIIDANQLSFMADYLYQDIIV